jgi:ParB-like chromosome segregation protein Spo0J
MTYRVALVEVAKLRPTEEADATHARGLAADMSARQVIEQPILVEETSLAILDGHHRYEAARQLGLSRLPAILIAYGDPRLTLSGWTGRIYGPEEVLEAAQSGRLLPQKSTRHTLNPPASREPVPLSALQA